MQIFILLSCKSVLRAQEKSKSRDLLFSIQSEGLTCNLTAGEYVIAEGVWHHASACILLRIDYIQHFVLIPYRRQAADSIHGSAVILLELNQVFNQRLKRCFLFRIRKNAFSFLLRFSRGGTAFGLQCLIVAALRFDTLTSLVSLIHRFCLCGPDYRHQK